MNSLRLFFKDTELVLIQKDKEITGFIAILPTYDYYLYCNLNDGFSVWIDSKLHNVKEESIPEQVIKLANLELLLEGIS